MEERFIIKRKEFKKLEQYAENIYNRAVVIDYLSSSSKLFYQRMILDTILSYFTFLPYIQKLMCLRY